MADVFVRYILFSTTLALLAHAPVVAVGVNTALSRESGCANMHPSNGLRDSFKAAIQSGKIRQVTHQLKKNVNMAAHTQNEGMCVGRISDHNELLDVNKWTCFDKVCNENEWKHFEKMECCFRQTIATKPMKTK
eukprot:TRINITY_DN4157_c1_g1_i3.p2 TRINITY_DN4157_c1_g1~~TRINITY_DN4157_c1_g1_i3.p2  ORF type:complete len:134 (+),score=16.84 TRINITY_DN4157_c1_g1_i3:676-1077(+)